MKTISPRTLRHALAALAALICFAAPAHATIFRAYLSQTGDDLNPCTLAFPCRLLPAALAAVDDGGEIWMLNSANFNTAEVAVNKSVTILAVPGALGSVIATGSLNGLLIDGPGVKVTLRNLLFVGLGASQNAIKFQQGSELIVEGCEVFGVQQNGILANIFNARVVVRSTVVRDNGESGIYLGGAVNAAVDGVHLQNNLYGISVEGSSKVNVADSVLTANTSVGIGATSTTGGTTQVTVERSTIRRSSTGLYAFSNDGIGSTTRIVSRGNVITDNEIGAYASTGTGTNATIALDANVIAGNGTGVFILGAGTSAVTTRQNSTFRFNTMDVVGSLVPAGPL